VRAEAFDLLTAIGRGCVGAVQLLPSDTRPEGWEQVSATVLSEAQVAAHLRNIVASASPFAGNEELDEFRISIAGTQ
jgi:serine/threonine-protein kinase HipA